MVTFIKQKYFLRLLLSLLMLLVMPVHAGLFDKNPFASDGPLDVEKAFVFGAIQEGNRLNLYWDMPDDYYLYRDRIEIKGFTNTQQLRRTNSPAEQKDDPLFGTVWVYHNRAEVTLELSSVTSAPADDQLSITYQGCWEGGICYPPVTKTVNVTAVQATPSSDINSAEGGKEQPSTPPIVSPQSLPQSEQDQFADLLKQSNLFLTLGAFFIAGLALSLTPCVFPMIPILSSIIAGQGRGVTAHYGFLLSLVYVLAVSVTYTIAGVIAGLFGENLQALFQNPWIISSFSLIFVLLALSMFGAFELQLPASLQAKLANASNSQKGGTFAGVAIMGFLSALIVGPCMAAPLAGALLYIGQTGDPVLGGSALFALSLGMGVPLLLVGASAGKFLPHAGVWMNRVKEFFGVVLLLMAIWMLDRIVSTQITMLLAAIVLIISGVYMGALSQLEARSRAKHRIAKGIGLVVIIYAIALMLGALSGNNSLIYPLKGLGSSGAEASSKLPFITVTSPDHLQRQLDDAKQQARPVMLDFYADWCVSCIELELVTFADPQAMKALKRFRLIKVDVTRNDENAKALNQAYQLIGPPALIFYNAQGELLTHKTLIGVVDPVDFVNHISDI